MSPAVNSNPLVPTTTPTTNTTRSPDAMTEQDRMFWLVLDMSFSQYKRNADLGYYYDCECEDTFEFGRLQVAASSMSLYRWHKPLRPSQTVLVQYVNMGAQPLAPDALRDVVLGEYELMLRLKSRIAGIADVYLVCWRHDAFYFFMEKPDQTLLEYILQHKSFTLPVQSSGGTSKSIINRRTTIRPRIPLREAKFIMRSVAITLLQLHQAGVVHGGLKPDSVFMVKRKKTNQDGHRTSNSQNLIAQVKLANFVHATQSPHAASGPRRPLEEAQSLTELRELIVEDLERSKDLCALHKIGYEMAEWTEFRTSTDADAFLSACHKIYANNEQLLDMIANLPETRVIVGEDDEGENPVQEWLEENVTDEYKSNFERLECFIASMATEDTTAAVEKKKRTTK